MAGSSRDRVNGGKGDEMADASTTRKALTLLGFHDLSGTAVAGLVSFTHYCIPSLIHQTLFARRTASQA